MRRQSYLLGLGFVAPSLMLVLLFFVLPGVLTVVTSFTNMTTSTGLGRGEYVVTSDLLRALRLAGVDPAALDAVARQQTAVTSEGLAVARAAGLDEAFVKEIESTLGRRQFPSEQSLQQALKQLRSAPRSPRMINVAVASFTETALNIRFRKAEELLQRLALVAPEVDPSTREMIVEKSYTGPVYTTENYVKLATTPNSQRYALNTVIYVVASLAFFNVTLGLLLALLMFYLPARVSTVFSTLWLLPRITPVVLYAVMWKWFTWDTGFLPVLAAQFGLPSFNYMTGSVISAWITMLCANGLGGASFGMIIFSGALRAIPQQQLWASEVDGANRWQQVWRIILPQLRWPVLFVTSYQTLSLLSSYEIIWLTTNGAPGQSTTVWALEAFKTALSVQYNNELQYGLGAAMAVVLVIIGLVLSLIYLRVFRFGELVVKPRIEL